MLGAVNGEKKTEIMHLRYCRLATSKFQFHFGKKKVNYTKSYKYLGLYLDEYMHFKKGYCSSLLVSQ